MRRRARQDDAGTELRDTLVRMHEALADMQGSLRAAFAGCDPRSFGIARLHSTPWSVMCVAARGAIGLVLSRERIPSLLVDNLNASVHLRALLTDLFLIEQALKSPARAGLAEPCGP